MAAFLASNGVPIPTADLLQASQDWEDTRHIARPRPVLIAAEGEIKTQQNAYQSRPHSESKPPCFLPGSLSPRCQKCKTSFNITMRQNNCQSCGTCLCNSCIFTEEVEVVLLHQRTSMSSSQIPSPSQGAIADPRVEEAIDLSLQRGDDWQPKHDLSPTSASKLAPGVRFVFYVQ